MQQKLQRLKIDGEFKRFIPPLSAEERKQLEENILKDGCRDALVVWNGTVIDGHNRYEICTKHGIPFATRNVMLRSREEAIAWICANQLGRRNISDETRRYLIGKRYDMEKKMNEERNASGINQYTEKEVYTDFEYKPKFTETATKTSERLAKEYKVAPSTVQKFSLYAQALDIIAQESPRLHESIMTGNPRMTQKKVVELSNLPPAEIRRIEAELPTEPTELVRYMDARGLIPKNTPNKVRLEQMNIGGIKEKPKYNPDAEVISLTLTIPSWISSITRVQSSEKLLEITDIARKKLCAELNGLQITVTAMLTALKGELYE